MDTQLIGVEGGEKEKYAPNALLMLAGAKRRGGSPAPPRKASAWYVDQRVLRFTLSVSYLFQFI